jgi:uroporphyrin-III C-methyltransferase
MISNGGTLTIVGAGPGDPELISLKGLNAVQKADVILYDALVTKELLKYAQPRCKLVYVGKRKGKKEFSQDEINKLLVFYAARFENVVRLKGGDPNVFGRGHEELEFVSKHNISVEIIPGISSAIAAPAAAGIPLTKRGVNESFWVITGTLSSGEMSNDIQLAAQSSATVIILMGVSHLKKIAELFVEKRSPYEPIAVIQEATMPSQKLVAGTVSDIERLVREKEITSPAVIVIGKVVEERRTLHTIIKKAASSPLFTFHQ